MHVRVSHQTTYSYRGAIKSATQLLRLTPRNHAGQSVQRWRVDTEPGARLIRQEDWFGNIVHSLFIEGPLESIVLTASGDVETEDSGGAVVGTLERFPPALFLRGTDLTAPDAALRALAEEIAASAATPLERAHSLLQAVHGRMHFDPGSTTATTTAAESFAAGHGVCQDLTHIFMAAARHIGLPARYVAGYLVQIGGPVEQDASHAWAEAFVPDLGWVSFDAANGVCATDGYVRVAIGLDSLDAAPVRGAHQGGAGERLEVKVHVQEARQRQE